CTDEMSSLTRSNARSSSRHAAASDADADLVAVRPASMKAASNPWRAGRGTRVCFHAHSRLSMETGDQQSRRVLARRGQRGNSLWAASARTRSEEHTSEL